MLLPKRKQCTKCGRKLPATTEFFYRNKGGKWGLRVECKECNNERAKQYRETHKDKITEYHKEYNKKYRDNNRDKEKERAKQYRETHKDKITEYHKEYYENNKDKITEYHKEYYENNPHIIFNYNNKRRQQEEQQGNGITKEQWLEMMEFFEWRCAYSGEYIGGNNKYRTKDHIIPLNKGGLNEIWNICPMYKPYNSSKHTSDMLEWYQKQDFFSEERLNKIYEWIEYAYNKWGNDETM